jgi:hypothetical protein
VRFDFISVKFSNRDILKVLEHLEGKLQIFIFCGIYFACIFEL